MIAKIMRYGLVVLSIVSPAVARDIILEFKGAYFLPTGSRFKDIYGGGALYGPELTVQLCEDKNWYLFTSIDYFSQDGHSLGLCDKTEVKMILLALGLKYFMPVCNDRIDVYLAAGFEPVNVRTKNCSQFVLAERSEWSLGGIAKFGAYYHLPHNFLIDLFVGYSGAHIGSNDCKCLPSLQFLKAQVSGAIFGAGLAYKF